MIKSMAEDKTGEWIAANCLPDCLFIRPSGNPFKAAESAKFTYKGTPNDDPSFTVSTVWKKVGGAWKLAHGHRSTATGNDMSSWDGCV